MALVVSAPSSITAQDLCQPLCWDPVLIDRQVGGGVQTSDVTDENTCKALCANNGTCIGVDWKASGDYSGCWFQMKPGNPTSGNGIRHWNLASSFTEECLPYCWKPVKNNSRVIGGTRTDDAKDENKCKLLCSNKPNCRGVDWNVEDSSCWLVLIDVSSIATEGIHHWDIVWNSSSICQTSLASTTNTPTTTVMTTTMTTTTMTTTTTTTTSRPTINTTPPEPTSVLTSLGTGETTVTATSDHTTTNQQQPLHDETNKIIGGVVGGVGGLILILTLLIIFILIRRRRKKKLSEEIPEKPISDLGGSRNTKEKPNSSKPVIASKPKIMPSTIPFHLTKLQKHFEKLNAEEDGFKNEFGSLPKENPDRCSTGRQSDSTKKKNRFKNVLPYDENRVKLQAEDGIEHSDYINASYIQGYNGDEKAYIASQGPLKTTLADFWRMIWNEEINRIIMITMLTELGHTKCEKYWPNAVNDSEQYGKISVTLVECHVCTDYTRRILHIKHKDEEETRSVSHLLFRLWKDKDVPADIYSLLSFRNRVRALDDSAKGPLLVHCSAGVGRTGTYIALDCLLEQAQKTEKVSVFGVVKKLREQRMHMVQLSDQYKLLYRAILEAHSTGWSTSLTSKSFEEILSNSPIESSLPELLTTRSKHEYELLRAIKESASANENSAVDIYDPQNSEESDFINEVLIKGYHCPSHYILAGFPSKNAASSFWQMIINQNCLSIIVLESSHDKDEVFAPFWPMTVKSTIRFGRVSVELISSSHHMGAFLDLELRLSQNGLSSTQVIHLYQLLSWEGKSDTPSSAIEVLELFGLTVDSQRKEISYNTDETMDIVQRKPVAIVCLDGTTKCGLFTAASYLIDKMQNDFQMDAYLSCRSVISSRPKAIVSLAQYEFLYQLAAKFCGWTPVVAKVTAHDCIDTYANFNQDASPDYADEHLYANSRQTILGVD